MIQDPLLKAVLKRAEFKAELVHDYWLCQALDDDIKSAKFENARLMPIIQGLCEEVQRRGDALERVLGVDTVKTVSDSEEVEWWLSNLEIRDIVDEALSTSALEKLGGGV